jgi:hypothetical protein
VKTIVSDIKGHAPHLLVFVGYEDTADILALVKTEDSLNKLPVLLTDGVASGAVATAYQSAEELPDLVFGVQPGFRTGAAYAHFLDLYETTSVGGTLPPPTWSEYTYDGVYLLAYAAAAIPPEEMTGAAFAETFTRFNGPGNTYGVGPSRLIEACHDMGEGKSIDVRGASGPLDFDLDTGEPETVGILRWKIDFPASSELGEGKIDVCGLAVQHEGGSTSQTSYWCNALCEESPVPRDQKPACDDKGLCEQQTAICADAICTDHDDCKPDLVP